jgi:hypothetical protein
MAAIIASRAEGAHMAYTFTELPPRAILCAGAKSSASTWLYNVIAEILRRRSAAEAACYARTETARRRGGWNVKQFYADAPGAFPQFDALSDTLVVQTQRPSAALCELAIRLTLPVVMTVREPRDAIASLVKRFGYFFAAAFKAVVSGNAPMVQLHRRAAPFVLRFEDRFYDREVTIAAVAEFLGIELSAPLLGEIFSGLTRQAVSIKIEQMRLRGVFGTVARPVARDPETRWQLGHVGDIAIGQHAEFLSQEQQVLVLAANADYCAEFGYPTEIDWS